MSNEKTFSNVIGIPKELVPIIFNNLVCEYASLNKHRTPTTIPLIPFPGEDGRTIDINTGLTYPSKAERARNNPKVCLLYSEPKGSPVENPPTILIYGKATVYDSNLQTNTDRYVKYALLMSNVPKDAPLYTTADEWISRTYMDLGDSVEDALVA